MALLDEVRVAGMQSHSRARKSLTVHGDLVPIGRTAFATTLGAEATSCNVTVGSDRDHLFVQWDRRDDALAALRRLSIA